MTAIEMKASHNPNMDFELGMTSFHPVIKLCVNTNTSEDLDASGRALKRTVIVCTVNLCSSRFFVVRSFDDFSL